MADGSLFAHSPHFLEFIQHYNYLGIFVWFLIFDQLTPIPGEISLLTIGYLCATGVFNHPLLAGTASIIAFFTIDVIYYFLARRGNRFIEKLLHKFGKFAETYKVRIEHELPKTLIVLMFIPRMRVLGPILVGSVRAPFKKFVFFDLIGLCLFTLVFLSLGIVFHNSLESLFSKVDHIGDFIFGISLIIICMAVFIVRAKTHKA